MKINAEIPQSTDVDPSSKQVTKSTTEKITEIGEWYFSLGADADFKNKEIADQLITNATEMLVLATNTDEQLERFKGDMEKKLDYVFNFKYANGELIDQKAALISGSMLLDHAYYADMQTKDKLLLLEGAARIFNFVYCNAEIESTDEVLGGQTKYSARGYFFDARIEALHIAYENDVINYSKFDEEIAKIQKIQTRNFIENMVNNQTEVRDGELNEHYLVLVGRYICWSDESLEEWRIRLATLREDQVAGRSKKHNWKNTSSDVIFRDSKSGKDYKIQAKLNPEAKPSDYAEEILFYNDLAYDKHPRDEIEKVANAIFASYRFIENANQEKILKKQKEFFYKFMSKFFNRAKPKEKVA
jgi:hypothetical protein